MISALIDQYHQWIFFFRFFLFNHQWIPPSCLNFKVFFKGFHKKKDKLVSNDKIFNYFGNDLYDCHLFFN